MVQSMCDANFLFHQEDNDLLSVYNDSTVSDTESVFGDNTEIVMSDSSDISTYSVTVESSDYEIELLSQIRVTNSLLGVEIALHVFMLAFAIMVFFIKVIKNNVTNQIL